MAEPHRIDLEGRPYDPSTFRPKPEVDPATFFSLDLRVGRIVGVEPFPEAREPAWKIAVDLGPLLGVRWTSAKVTNYGQQELVGRTVVAAVNLGPKRIAGFVSELLLLGGLEPDGTVRLLAPDTGLPPGAPVA